MSSFVSGIRGGIRQNQDEAVQAGAAIRAKKTMFDQAMGRPGAFAAIPETPEQTGGVSNVDRSRPGAKFGSRPGEKRIDTKGMSSPNIKGYKKGGKIKKTAIIKAHKGERVLNAKQTKKLEGLAKGLSK